MKWWTKNVSKDWKWNWIWWFRSYFAIWWKIDD